MRWPVIASYAEGRAARAGQFKVKVKSMKRKITAEGQACRKCETPVIGQSHKQLPPKQRPGQEYYFERWFRCPKCGAFYMLESAKRYFPAPDQPSLPIEIA